MQCLIPVMSLALDPEDTLEQEKNSGVVVILFVGLRREGGGIFVFTQLSLIPLQAEILKASHTSINIEFIWWGKTLASRTSAYRTPFYH